MIERFKGEEGARRLLSALLEFPLVNGEDDLGRAVLAVADVREVNAEDVLINQDGSENEVFLIITGSVSVTVNNRPIARRTAGQHVGELAVIDPRAKRGASIVALERSVVARITEAEFCGLAERFPQLWHRLAKELGHRLRERNSLVAERRDRPLLFIGTSAEALPIARALQSALRYDKVTVRVWTDNVFGASRFPMDDLQKVLEEADFAVLVATPDDMVTSRGKEQSAPRDNVVFELGLVIGALSRSRSFLLCGRGVDMKLPTDLLGLTPLEYDADASVALSDRIAPVANDLREIILKKGTR